MSEIQSYAVEARRWTATHKAGHITASELAIELAALLGVDIRCDMGECHHAP